MLLPFATTQSHFLLNDFVYDQIDGVPMGSPLAPILDNLFMGYHEKSWLENYKDSKISIYRRYVDDIFCLFDNELDAVILRLHQRSTSQHKIHSRKTVKW